MHILAYIGRRLLFVAPQLVGILLVSFLLVKTHPGRSGGADARARPRPTRPRAAARRARPRPLAPRCSSASISGRSSMAISAPPGRRRMPVTEDLAQRFPATLELVTLRLLLALLIGLPLGVAGARQQERHAAQDRRLSTAWSPAPCPTSGSRWC